MSKAGQSTITGVSAQADAALAYLLSVYTREDFIEAIIEGTSWEDFTLIFREYRVDFEVKWHAEALSWGLLRSIVRKELKKNLRKDDRLGVVAKSISPKLYSAWESLQGVDLWWKSLSIPERRKHRAAKPFLAKGFTLREVEFLRRTNLTALQSSSAVRELIVAHFALTEPFYLTDADTDSLVARCFRDLMTLGKTGQKISKGELKAKMEEFVKEIAVKSESFTPDIHLKDRVVNLKDFLSGVAALKKLNHERYITPISATPRLVYYLLDAMESRDFRTEDFSFLIDTVFKKDRYLDFAVRLLEKKVNEGKGDPKYAIKFVEAHYPRMRPHFAGDAALGLLKKIADGRLSDDLAEALLTLLKKRCLNRLSSGRDFWRLRGQRDAREEESVAKILLKLFESLPNQRTAIEFIFQYFNFTSDDFELLTDTPPAIYGKVEGFLSEDFERRYRYILQRVNRQFQQAHGKIYIGAEHIGSGVSQAGPEFSVTDIGVVRFVFGPAFKKAYDRNPERTWTFLKRNVFRHLKSTATLECPSFIFRSLIPVLNQIAASKTEKAGRKEEAFAALAGITGQKFSIHNTSDFVFSQLIADKFLDMLAPEAVMVLVRKDLSKFRKPPKGAAILPTSIFTVKTLVILAVQGSIEARELLLKIAEHPLFAEWDRDKDTLEHLALHGLVEKDPDFCLSFIQKLNLKKFLARIPSRDIFGKNAIIRGLLKADWQNGRDRAAPLIHELLADAHPDERAIEFVTGMIHELLKIDALKTYELFEPYLSTAAEFRSKFWRPHSRDDFAWLAEALIGQKEFDKARRLLDYLIEDPDPLTDRVERDFNYHLQILKGEDVRVISSVRGKTGWVLQRVAAVDDPGMLRFALRSIASLLDLDGALARKLGYAEADQYVRGNALIALATLAHPAKRKALEAAEAGLGEVPKQLAFQALRVTDQMIEKEKVTPDSVLSHLAYALNPFRDLNTAEAAEMLDIFERRQVEKAAHLFVYYAVYRKKFHEHIEFDSKPFEERLRQVCRGSSELRSSIAHQFWRVAEGQEKGGKANQFDDIEEYWFLLAETYDKEVYARIYHTLEITLAWEPKYARHKEFLKHLISTEQKFLALQGEGVELWGAGRGIGDLLTKKSPQDFLDVFYPLLMNLPANVHYWDLSDWVGKFEGIKEQVAADPRVKELEVRLDQLFPEKRLGR